MPLTDAVSVCAPALGPSVHGERAIPSLPVTTGDAGTKPPPVVTVKLTATPPRGSLALLRTITAGSVATGTRTSPPTTVSLDASSRAGTRSGTGMGTVVEGVFSAPQAAQPTNASNARRRRREFIKGV